MPRKSEEKGHNAYPYYAIGNETKVSLIDLLASQQLEVETTNLCILSCPPALYSRRRCLPMQRHSMSEMLLPPFTSPAKYATSAIFDTPKSLNTRERRTRRAHARVLMSISARPPPLSDRRRGRPCEYLFSADIEKCHMFGETLFCCLP